MTLVELTRSNVSDRQDTRSINVPILRPYFMSRYDIHVTPPDTLLIAGWSRRHMMLIMEKPLLQKHLKYLLRSKSQNIKVTFHICHQYTNMEMLNYDIYDTVLLISDLKLIIYEENRKIQVLDILENT